MLHKLHNRAVMSDNTAMSNNTVISDNVIVNVTLFLSRLIKAIYSRAKE